MDKTDITFLKDSFERGSGAFFTVWIEFCHERGVTEITDFMTEEIDGTGGHDVLVSWMLILGVEKYWLSMKMSGCGRWFLWLVCYQ